MRSSFASVCDRIELRDFQTTKYLTTSARSLPLSYQFIQDASQYQDEQLQRPIPTLILHGIHDETIPIQASRNFAASRPWVKLIELDSDHSLANVLYRIRFNDPRYSSREGGSGGVGEWESKRRKNIEAQKGGSPPGFGITPNLAGNSRILPATSIGL